MISEPKYKLLILEVYKIIGAIFALFYIIAGIVFVDISCKNNFVYFRFNIDLYSFSFISVCSKYKKIWL